MSTKVHHRCSKGVDDVDNELDDVVGVVVIYNHHVVLETDDTVDHTISEMF